MEEKRYYCLCVGQLKGLKMITLMLATQWGKLCGAVRSRDQTVKALRGGIYLVAVIEPWSGTIKDGDQCYSYSLIYRDLYVIISSFHLEPA